MLLEDELKWIKIITEYVKKIEKHSRNSIIYRQALFIKIKDI
jgi:hypothetical protein